MLVPIFFFFNFLANLAQGALLHDVGKIGIPDAQAKVWQQKLEAAFPDVQKNDRILGIYLPQTRTARFLTNGQPTGEVSDGDFARLFFGIWLSPQTSEPAMRKALLAGNP